MESRGPIILQNQFTTWFDLGYILLNSWRSYPMPRMDERLLLDGHLGWKEDPKDHEGHSLRNRHIH